MFIFSGGSMSSISTINVFLVLPDGRNTSCVIEEKGTVFNLAQKFSETSPLGDNQRYIFGFSGRLINELSMLSSLNVRSGDSIYARITSATPDEMEKFQLVKAVWGSSYSM